jgi:phytoene desaturase
MAGKVIVLGAGFSGLSAAASLANYGFKVEVIEKHNYPGGRARKFESEGFSFDIGPSWYSQPNLIQDIFAELGHPTEEYFELRKLETLCKLFPSDGQPLEIHSDSEQFIHLFENLTRGKSKKRFDLNFLRSTFSDKKQTPFNYSDNSTLNSISGIPAILFGDSINSNKYSLHTFLLNRLKSSQYPVGGFSKIAEALEKICVEKGVEFTYNVTIDQLDVMKNRVIAARSGFRNFYAENFVSSADYYFTDQKLLPKSYQNYKKEFWETKAISPSVMIYFIGLNKKLKNLAFHNIFIDSDIKKQYSEIWESPRWPESPMFYVQAKSVLDKTSAPEGCENITVVIPVASGLEDHGKVREHYFEWVISRLEKELKTSLQKHIVFHKSYAQSNFITDYNAFKGNAYGLLTQPYKNTRPAIRNKKLPNLYYTGHMTVPGPGVYNALISGKMVAGQLFGDAGGHMS